MIDDAPIDGNAMMNIETDYYHAIFNGRLCPSPKDSDGKRRKDYPFHTMWELFVYAFLLGITHNKLKVVEKPYKPFRWINISNPHQKNLLILAVSKSNSLDILKDGEALKKLIEEYANGGLSVIFQEIKNNPSAYTDLETLAFRVLNDAEAGDP